MKATTLAYFAGAIDADGFISIQRTIRKVGKRYATAPTYYTAKVGFTGTADPSVQEMLKATFGGSVYTHRPKNKAHKPWHSWQATNQKTKACLMAVRKYLISKRGQADLTLEFISLCDRQWREVKRTQIPPYRITAAMQKERERLWLAVTRLNSPRNRRVHFAPSGI